MKNDEAKKYYIFLGRDIDSSDCFINYDEKTKLYFIDDNDEGSFTKVKFTKAEVETARKKLASLRINDGDVIPVKEY